MTIKTYSAFTYGHTVTDENKYFQFDEGSGELTAEIEIGSYTLGAYVNALATALNNTFGKTLTYTTALDRTTRKITVSADGNFSILVSSGTLVGADAFALTGFTGADLSGASSYEGDIASGEYFEPQFYLQNYTPFENNFRNVQATVNETASGAVEVVSYGVVNFMECLITLQTNKKQGKGSVVKTDLQGETSLRNFLKYATTKAPMEFVPDVDTPTTFTDCLLETTAESGKGVDAKVKELYARGFADWYESGLLTFRELK